MIQRHLLETRAADVLAEKRRVVVTCNTETKGRDNLIVMSRGIDLTAYRTNPIVMFQHNPDWPIARAVEISVKGNDLVATVQFPEAGASPRADEVYSLIRAGVINAVSTGFETHDEELINPANSRAGVRITARELQEFSFVSIPALPDALVTERSNRAHRGRNAGKILRQRRAALYEAELETAPVVRKEAPAQHSMQHHRRMAALYEMSAEKPR
jgi:HK97 family phage prohead protease